MRCLTDIDIQAVVDEEASPDVRVHVADCERCRARVEDRRASLTTLSSMMRDDTPPVAAMETRLRHTMDTGSPVRGSTVLRAPQPAQWRRVGVVSALATAAVIALVVYGVLPRLGAPTTLSASEVLNRSLQTITGGQGVERLEYEVNMDGMTGGPVVIRQVIDRDNPHRYKVASYRPDGTIATAVSQDPTTQQRTQLFHVDGTNYIVRVGAIHTPVLSIPQMAQALVETSIGMMQAKSDQQLTVEEGANGRRYIVEIPQVTTTSAASTLDLFTARAVISGADFRIQEFEATGTMLRQPFSVSLKLRTHEYVGGDATADSFAITPGPNDVVLDGQAAEDPITESMTTVLRELGRTRGK